MPHFFVVRELLFTGSPFFGSQMYRTCVPIVSGREMGRKKPRRGTKKKIGSNNARGGATDGSDIAFARTTSALDPRRERKGELLEVRAPRAAQCRGQFSLRREISRHILPTNPNRSLMLRRNRAFSFYEAMIPPVRAHGHVRSRRRFSLFLVFSPFSRFSRAAARCGDIRFNGLSKEEMHSLLAPCIIQLWPVHKRGCSETRSRCKETSAPFIQHLRSL